jgi:pyridoxamine 5'-phosphate oxidase
LNEAKEAGVTEPYAMTLATASLAGQPSARILLLKGLGADGLRFFTNMESAKGRDLAERPKAALCFFWPELQRQARVEGRVSQLSAADSTAYFNSRPRGSRLAAWASEQSREIADRATLEASLQAMQERFGDGEIPRPEFWGGYLLIPTRFEFWQGGGQRLHDRFQYEAATSGEWRIARLAP